MPGHDVKPEEVDKLLLEARKALEKWQATPVEDAWNASLREPAIEAAEKGLKALELRRDRLAKAGTFGLTQSMAYLAMGDADQATLAFLRMDPHVRPADVINAILAAGRGLVAARDEFEATKKLLKEIGKDVASAALPLLILALKSQLGG